MSRQIEISAGALRRIKAHALRAYPNECCGLMLGPSDESRFAGRLRECVNAQDAHHHRDPVDFPRTARDAYFIDPAELLDVEREMAKRGERIRVIYHSHCDADAYFSEEDLRRALFEGEPVFPGAVYLVVSVRGGRIAEEKVFSWSRKWRRFVAHGCGFVRV